MLATTSETQNVRRRRPITDPEVVGCRDSLPAVLMLQLCFDVPYAALVDEARRTGACSEADLVDYGFVLYEHWLAVGRGEGSAFTFEKRLPRPGEFRPVVA